jgi:hypothetical protein
MTDRPGTGCALAVMLGALLIGGCVAGVKAVEPTGEVGTALVGGTASHVPASWGDSYLALPEHQWGQRGLLVTVCGEGCVTRRSPDVDPSDG